MNSEGSNQHVILVAPDSPIGHELEPTSLRVLSWPRPEIQAPQVFTELDEAIENLYGYDWIIFVNSDAVRFFLERLNRTTHEVSDLDSLRVGAIGEGTMTSLEQAEVHVDVVATGTRPSVVVEQLVAYTGADSLDRLNFLLPQSAIGRDYLKTHLEDNGARADVAVAYQTVATNELTRLAGLQSMLLTGSVDVVALGSPDDVADLARVFDTPALDRLVPTALVLTADGGTTNAAHSAGISKPLELSDFSAPAIRAQITQRLAH